MRPKATKLLGRFPAQVWCASRCAPAPRLRQRLPGPAIMTRLQFCAIGPWMRLFGDGSRVARDDMLQTSHLLGSVVYLLFLWFLLFYIYIFSHKISFWIMICRVLVLGHINDNSTKHVLIILWFMEPVLDYLRYFSYLEVLRNGHRHWGASISWPYWMSYKGLQYIYSRRI